MLVLTGLLKRESSEIHTRETATAVDPEGNLQLAVDLVCTGLYRTHQEKIIKIIIRMNDWLFLDFSQQVETGY